MHASRTACGAIVPRAPDVLDVGAAPGGVRLHDERRVERHPPRAWGAPAVSRAERLLGLGGSRKDARIARRRESVEPVLRVALERAHALISRELTDRGASRERPGPPPGHPRRQPVRNATTGATPTPPGARAERRRRPREPRRATEQNERPDEPRGRRSEPDERRALGSPQAETTTRGPPPHSLLRCRVVCSRPSNRSMTGLLSARVVAFTGRFQMRTRLRSTSRAQSERRSSP